MKRIIFSLPAAMKAAAEAAARARGEAVSVWLREAVREKLERERVP